MQIRRKGESSFLETKRVIVARGRRDVSSTSPPSPRTSGALNDVIRCYGSLTASSPVSGNAKRRFLDIHRLNTYKETVASRERRNCGPTVNDRGQVVRSRAPEAR